MVAPLRTSKATTSQVPNERMNGWMDGRSRRILNALIVATKNLYSLHCSLCEILQRLNEFVKNTKLKFSHSLFVLSLYLDSFPGMMLSFHAISLYSPRLELFTMLRRGRRSFQVYFTHREGPSLSFILRLSLTQGWCKFPPPHVYSEIISCCLAVHSGTRPCP